MMKGGVEEERDVPAPEEKRAGRRAAVIPSTTDLDLSPDGRLLAECREQGIARIWDVEAALKR